MNDILLIARKYSNSILQLTRVVPVLSWSAAAIILATGLAYHDLHGWQDVNGLVLTLCVLSACILQGIVAHAFNDRTDWESGTDKESAGILSGGSRVILDNKLSYQQLFWIGLFGMAATIGFGVYLSITDSRWTFVFLLIGLWSCISYSCKPFQFAYKPLIGEWFSAFPAMVACLCGTFYLLTGTITIQASVCSILHSLLCVSWLMQHHLADIPADRIASPPKITTPVWVTQQWGITYTKYVPIGCFIIACLVSLTAIWLVNDMYLISLGISLLGIWLSNRTDPTDVVSITKNELLMILLTLVHAVAIAIASNTITY